MLLDGESLDEHGGMTAYFPIPVAQAMWPSHMDRYDRLAMKATLNLNDWILRQAKGRAAQDGVTLTRFVEFEEHPKEPLGAAWRSPRRSCPSTVLRGLCVCGGSGQQFVDAIVPAIRKPVRAGGGRN